MKHFNPKSPYTQRSVLFAALVAVLGFNVSWNPEATVIAKNDYAQRFGRGHTEMASQEPVTIRLDSADPKLKGLEIQGRFNSDRTVLLYDVRGRAEGLEGSVCTDDCLRNQRLSISANDSNNPDYLARFLAGEVMDKIRAQQSAGRPAQVAANTRATDVAPGPVSTRTRPRIEAMSTECEEDEGARQMACFNMEFREKLEECNDFEGTEAKRDKDTCLRRFDEYVRRYMREPIASALSESPFTPTARAATTLVQNLKARRSKALGADFYQMMAQSAIDGVRTRAQTVYSSCMGCTSGIASGYAYQSMNQESPMLTQFLNSTRTGYTGADATLANQAFTQMFQSPLQAMMSAYQNNISNSQMGYPDPTTNMAIPGLNGTSLGLNSNGSPGLGQTTLAPGTRLQHPRGMGMNNQGQQQQYPGFFQSPRASGVPSLPQQNLTPTLRRIN